VAFSVTLRQGAERTDWPSDGTGGQARVDQVDGVRVTSCVSARGADDPQPDAHLRLVAILDATPDSVLTIDTTGRVRFANAAARAVLGVAPADDLAACEVDVRDLYSPLDRRRVRDEIIPELERSGSWTGEMTIWPANGGVRVVGQISIAHFAPDGTVDSFSAILRDAAPEQAAPDAPPAATRDRLTGLGGRELFLDRLEHCANRSARTSERYAVMFCDLDGFKLVNDVFGHDAGDRVLAEVAARLRTLVRPYDTVARFGGDEFVILVEDVVDALDVVNIGRRIVNALAEPIPLQSGDATVGVSIGVVVAGDGEDSPASLLARADTAMYEAKRCGKGRVELFGPDLDRRLTERRELGRDLGGALERAELELRYRTVASLVTGDVTSLEASVRWNHATRGCLEPDEFIPIASTTGMIEQIDQWVLASAARDVASWRADHPTLVAWITVSGKLFVHGDEAARILAILEASGADPRTIGIEIGEDTVVRNFAEIATVLRGLHDGGICIALDNFSGRLTVPQLQALRPDAVKLDRGFLTRLGADVESAKAIRSLTGMIRPLGITIVAKGVDTREQLAAVLALNCDEAQGAVISRPVPAAEIEFERRGLDAPDPQLTA
jgi:diguanylate cyclase (GGDEF)-like protein